MVPQVVICEEFDSGTAFMEGKLEATKLLFEGRGGMIRHNLYDKFYRAYEDCVFIIATNKLPASEAQGRDKWNKNIWEPITKRVDISSLTDSHNESVEFPYTSG